MSFLHTLSSLVCTRESTSLSVTHPQIAPGQTRLTSEFFGDRLPEKKLQLVGMNILLILLSSRPGCHTLLPLGDGDAARTMVLARRWQHIWPSETTLVRTNSSTPTVHIRFILPQTRNNFFFHRMGGMDASCNGELSLPMNTRR